VQEIAALGRCSAKTCRRAIDAGRLVAFKTAGRLLIREEDARAWIESRPVHPDRLPLPARPRAVKRSRSAAKGSFADLMRIDSAVGGRQTRRPLS
jgi:excisionase family DNA binding protein